MDLDDRDINDLLEILDWAKPKSTSNHVTDSIQRLKNKLTHIRNNPNCDNCGEPSFHQIVANYPEPETGYIEAKNYCRECYYDMQRKGLA